MKNKHEEAVKMFGGKVKVEKKLSADAAVLKAAILIDDRTIVFFA